MTEAKKHHYVPQFYLRNFSKNGKQISLYNFNGDFFKNNATITGQCYRRKLHDFKPGLEQDLGNMESAASSAIRSVMKGAKLPTRETEEYRNLLDFFFFQKFRTVRSILANKAILDFYAEQMASDKNIEYIRLIEKITSSEKLLLGLIFFTIPKISKVVDDLNMHLIVNDSSEDFITCDDPVVLHNMYCEGITQTGVLGWDCTGIQGFLPLSPKMLLMMYDNNIYKVNDNLDLPFVTSTKDVRDVRCFNTFQALNAHENVYFHGELTQELETFCRQKREKRVRGRTTQVVTKPLTKEDGTLGELLHSFEPLLPIRFTPHFMKVRQWALSVPLQKRAAMFRHPLPDDAHPNIRNFVPYEVDQIQHR